ncbi:hypothetical protein H5410_027448 [Solanum commersonii]|uniref:Uncharacterized protein n=1 Tax=Solanum commersonii TaxID=4109 RepID=A0A9J5Z3E0_SOLCO|nr:hypothetical protein H5410_027448 [Solanum commersonii]
MKKCQVADMEKRSFEEDLSTIKLKKLLYISSKRKPTRSWTSLREKIERNMQKYKEEILKCESEISQLRFQSER